MYRLWAIITESQKAFVARDNVPEEVQGEGVKLCGCCALGSDLQ